MAARMEGAEDVIMIVELLMKECARRGFGLTGFVFKPDEQAPFLMHFGTVKETGPALTQVHVMLCDMVEEASGTASHRIVKP